MGEARDEAEARLMIESQQRGSVTWRESTDRYRWTVVLDDGGKTHHGWAETETEAEGWACVREVLNRPHRGVRHVQRTRRCLPPL